MIRTFHLFRYLLYTLNNKKTMMAKFGECPGAAILVIKRQINDNSVPLNIALMLCTTHIVTGVFFESFHLTRFRKILIPLLVANLTLWPWKRFGNMSFILIYKELQLNLANLCVFTVSLKMKQATRSVERSIMWLNNQLQRCFGRPHTFASALYANSKHPKCLLIRLLHTTNY